MNVKNYQSTTENLNEFLKDWQFKYPVDEHHCYSYRFAFYDYLPSLPENPNILELGGGRSTKLILDLLRGKPFYFVSFENTLFWTDKWKQLFSGENVVIKSCFGIDFIGQVDRKFDFVFLDMDIPHKVLEGRRELLKNCINVLKENAVVLCHDAERWVDQTVLPDLKYGLETIYDVNGSQTYLLRWAR